MGTDGARQPPGAQQFRTLWWVRTLLLRRVACTAAAGTMRVMCRYVVSTYRTHFVCVPCRASRKEWPRPAGSTPVTCTRCRSEMVDAGHDVHIPRRADRRGWDKLGLLLEDGTRFSGCGCNGPGEMPATLASAKAALALRERREEAERREFPLRAARDAQLRARYGRRPTFGRSRART